MRESTPPELPLRADWRKALDVYVAARSRVLDADEKRHLAMRAPQDADDARSGGSRPSATPARVTVPRELAFFRNAGTWRDRIAAGDSRDDTTSDG